MNISPARLEEFKQLYKKELGEDLSDQEALNIAIPFLEMFRVICRPLPKGHSCRYCAHKTKAQPKSNFGGEPVRFEPPNSVRDIIAPQAKHPSSG